MSNVIYDIGANQGDFTEGFLGDETTVISVEPNPVIFEKLQNRFTDNENVITINKAVSSDKGEVEFYVPSLERKHTIATCSKNWFEGRFKYVFDEGYETLKIESVSLDDLIEEHGSPSRIKIDVEGYEYNVIQSLTKKIDNCVISLEWTSEIIDEARKILLYLDELGYTQFAIMDSDKGELHQWYAISELYTKNIESYPGGWGDIFVK